MYSQSSIKSLVVLAVGVMGISLLSANADAVTIVGVDLNNAGAADQSPGASDVVGPVATSGWNNLFNITSDATAPLYYYHPYNGSDHGNPATLLDTTGASTGIKFGFNSYGFSTYNGGSTYSPGYGPTGSPNAALTPNQQLFNGAVKAGGGGYTQQFTLSNIPFAKYDVYVIGSTASYDPAAGLGSVQLFDGGLTPTATAGAIYWFRNGNTTNDPMPASGFSWVQAVGTSQGAATVGANYALFSGLTSSTVTFDISAPGIPYNNGIFVGGIEIVEVVPEPATLGLLAIGGLLMIARRRRA